MDENITYEEAARRMKCSARTVYRYVREGILTPVRVPVTPRSYTVRLRASDVDALLSKSA